MTAGKRCPSTRQKQLSKHFKHNILGWKGACHILSPLVRCVPSTKKNMRTYTVYWCIIPSNNPARDCKITLPNHLTNQIQALLMQVKDMIPTIFKSGPRLHSTLWYCDQALSRQDWEQYCTSQQRRHLRGNRNFYQIWKSCIKQVKVKKMNPNPDKLKDVTCFGF